MKLKIDEELEVRRSLEGGGAMGLFASFTAQLIDPINVAMMFIPGVNIARGASLAKSTDLDCFLLMALYIPLKISFLTICLA